MESRQLRTFLIVAELLSFNRAAERLNFAQSTISARIKALEQEVGLPLFDRLGKKVALTEAGRMMVRYAGKMVDLEAETLYEISGKKGDAGTISIRMPQSLGTHMLPRILPEFQEKHPRVNLDINTCTFSRLKKELRSGITDLAFLLYDEVNQADLDTRVLGFVNLLFICAKDSALRGREGVSLHDLENETLFLPKHDCRYKTKFNRTLLGLDIKAGSVMEVNSIETIKACVQAGAGIALLPEFAVEQGISQGRFTDFAIEDGIMETAVLMVMHKDKWLSPSLKSFISLVQGCRF